MEHPYIWICAVSYTHLYFRQAFRGTHCLKYFVKEFLLCFMLELMLQKINMIAVSYTHLDVYKRQGSYILETTNKNIKNVNTVI